MQAKPVETELNKAFIDPGSVLVKLAGLSSRYLNVILVSDSEEGLEELKELLPQTAEIDVKEVTDVYRDYPENFLSEHSRKLIENRDYKSLEEESLARVYNPLGIYIAPPNSDPYLLATDYALKNSKNEDLKKIDGQFYLLMRYKIKSLDDVSKFLEAQKSAVDGKIYLAGVPVHSYITSQKSAFEINIICIVSTLALIFLCRYYFKSIKIIIPIGLSILYGFLLGYSVSTMFFDKLHILTFVFSTSLIGISLDYSLHYLFI